MTNSFLNVQLGTFKPSFEDCTYLKNTLELFTNIFKHFSNIFTYYFTQNKL